MVQSSAQGRHRPRHANDGEERPAGIPAQVIVNWYWVRRTAMAPTNPAAARRGVGAVAS